MRLPPAGMQSMNGPPYWLERAAILPETEHPDPAELIAKSRVLAADMTVGGCAFLSEQRVDCELTYKRRCVEQGRIMFQAQVGYRDIDKTERACLEIHDALERNGYRVDRYGLIFDRNMGYPREIRKTMPRGTGLIVEDPERLARLTENVPVAPHFGDHMIGPPASVENTAMALAAGATSLGNLAQYYTFDLLYEGGDIARTSATIEAIALAAAQPVPVIIHSNLDDGFAALFTDLCCCLGMVLVEQHIVGDLLGGVLAHCFGQTFSDPFNRIAFQRALRRVEPDAGTMIYGETTAYGPDETANIPVLINSVTADVIAQRLGPSLHALMPVPLTEFSRIPEPEEIIDVHRIANRVADQLDPLLALFDMEAADAAADRLVAGAGHFNKALLTGFEDAGIDTTNAFEMLLAIKRLGARRLEQLFGPGGLNGDEGRRAPVVPASPITELERRSDALLAELPSSLQTSVQAAHLVGCVATTDVHEWGKLILERVLARLDVGLVDGGVNADPDALAILARDRKADFIALSTYNGIALTYVEALRRELAEMELDIPIFVGGRLNQVPEGSNTSLPVDVTNELREAGCIACDRIEQMLERLAEAPRKEV